MTRSTIARIIAASLLAGACVPPDGLPAGQPERPALPMPPLAPEGGPPGRELAPWRSDQHPWAACRPGDWVCYRLRDGSEELWWLERVENGQVWLALCARTSRDRDWEPTVLRFREPADRWSLPGELPAGTPSAATTAASKAGAQLPALRWTTPSRHLVTSAAVPGGVVLDGPAPTPELPAPPPERRLMAFGVGS